MVKRPELEKYWTTIYYGAKGSCKTLHQGKETLNVLEYLERLYKRNPQLKSAIVLTNQKFSADIEARFLNKYLFYWEDAEDFQDCPRVNCWRGDYSHRLHGVYLIFDDMATILPADSWNDTPLWLRKCFSQARHFGIRVLANLQDPFSCDINFRRYVDVAYKFTKIIGTRDPDETKKPIKHIFGIYRRRRIPAENLWRFGDLPEQTIRLMALQKEELNDKLKDAGKQFSIVYDDSWRGSYHYFTKKDTRIYDTQQDIKEWSPLGYTHREFKCIDENHNHEDKTAPNYCGYKKVTHELI